MNNLKVLIVDDSRTFRSIIRSVIRNQKDIELVGEAENGREALEKIRELKPDLVTLDVEMPVMNGLETLEEIMKMNRGSNQRTDVIMISSLTRAGADTTIKALELGAIDFIAKPATSNATQNLDMLKYQLLVKIRVFSTRKITKISNKNLSSTASRTPEIQSIPPAMTASAAVRKAASPPAVKIPWNPSKVEAILIGVSTGGPKALLTIIPEICKYTETPILIAQHMPPRFTQSLAESLNQKCDHKCIEASDGLKVEKNMVYIGPGGEHILLKNKGGLLHIEIKNNIPGQLYNPSVDLFFESAVNALTNPCIAMVLTGMGSDGTMGLKKLKTKRCYAIAQDEKSSVVWGMPGSVTKAGLVDRVSPLDDIPGVIAEYLSR